MRSDRRTWLARSAAAAALVAWGDHARAQIGLVQYQYDELGRVVSVTYPNGASITYAYDPAGNRTQSAQTPGAGAPTAVLSASPLAVLPGNPATLTWSTTNATSATIDNGVGAVTPISGGTISVTPSKPTTYVLTATGPGGVATAQVTVDQLQTYTQTIQVTGTGPVNLRMLANAAGYNGAQNATITFVVGAGVTLKGAPGTASTAGGRCIETGTWPSASFTIALTLQISGKVYGGGGGGGVGAGYGPGSLGTAGGDGLYAQEHLTVVVNAGGELKAGGGGGGGGGAWIRNMGGEYTYWNGGGGGGGFPNGAGGAAGEADGMTSAAGSAGTTSGGGAGGAGGAAMSSRVNGAGGAGGAAAAAGANGVAPSGTGGSGAWSTNGYGFGGAAGYAIRKNGKTVNVTNNGVIAGAQG